MTHPDHLADDVLSALVDGQLSPDETSQAQAHLGTCPDCQARLAELQELVGLLRALPSVEPPRDFRLGPRLVVDPPNVIRLRRWYAWTRAGAGALAAAFVFLSVGTLYVDSRPATSPTTLASKAQPSAPELATAPQNPAAPATRNAVPGAASDTAAPAPPAAGAPAAQAPAAPAPAAARPAAVPAASPAAQAGAAVRSQAATAPTSTEPGDQIAAATTVRPLPTQVPTPTLAAQPATPFASAAATPQPTDPAAPLRLAAFVVGALAAFGILFALLIRHRLQTASHSHLE